MRTTSVQLPYAHVHTCTYETHGTSTHMASEKSIIGAKEATYTHTHKQETSEVHMNKFYQSLRILTNEPEYKNCCTYTQTHKKTHILMTILMLNKEYKQRI